MSLKNCFSSVDQRSSTLIPFYYFSIVTTACSFVRGTRDSVSFSYSPSSGSQSLFPVIPVLPYFDNRFSSSDQRDGAVAVRCRNARAENDTPGERKFTTKLGKAKQALRGYSLRLALPLGPAFDACATHDRGGAEPVLVAHTPITRLPTTIRLLRGNQRRSAISTRVCVSLFVFPCVCGNTSCSIGRRARSSPACRPLARSAIRRAKSARCARDRS